MKVSIIAAVAVLLINIEKIPVTSKNPKRTNSDLLPKGNNNILASCTSMPILEAMMAMTKPPRKSMIVGSAKAPITALCDNNVPTFSPSLIKTKELSVHVNNIITTINIDVVHDGIASVNHNIKAKAKIAMTRCSTIEMFGNPIADVGMNHNTKNTIAANAILMI